MCISITPDWDIWDSIAIVIALDSLYNDFSAITKSKLELRDKTIDKIQQILTSTEAKFINKSTIRVTNDLVMMSKSRNLTK